MNRLKAFSHSRAARLYIGLLTGLAIYWLNVAHSPCYKTMLIDTQRQATTIISKIYSR